MSKFALFTKPMYAATIYTQNDQVLLKSKPYEFSYTTPEGYTPIGELLM